MNDTNDINTARLLIVDDDIGQTEMECEFLRISGFNDIHHAENIHGMWRMLKNNSYDIMLLDYKLPDGTGLDVLSQLAERGYQIPVVMVTGHGDERVAAQAIQRGAVDYLIKLGDYLFTLPALIHKVLDIQQTRLSAQRSMEQVHYQAILLNNVRDAVVVWDMSGNITYWNPAAAALFGWSAEERLGQPVAQVYLYTFAPSIVPVQDAANGQHVMRQHTNRRGKTVWVSSHVSVLQEAEGERLIGYMDVSHDITPRVEAEQALKKSEARYRAIVEDYQTELICRFKPNGTLTFVNEVFCHYFGKTRNELLGKNFLYFIPENERARVIRHLASFKPDKTMATMEHQINLPERGTRWLQRTDRAILDAHGGIFEFQSMGRDITDRKNMEAQIQAAQTHLVQAARLATIGEMASGVAHQIYNPLTTIIGDAQLLRRSLPNDHAGRDSIDAIEEAGWRLQRVVQRLMEFSKPTTNTLASLSINETIQSAIALAGVHIEAIGCRLEVDLSDGLPAVRGNSQQLENLWANLLLLARDASADGGQHTVRLVSKAGPSGYVTVEVRDDGQPIPTDQLATIFEPNFVGPTSGRGTGMELSVCREIVRQHSGQISVDGAPEHDTIFRVVLPVEVKDETS